MKLWRYQYPNNHSENIALDKNRNYWLQVVRGNLTIDDLNLSGCDALGIRQESALELATHSDVEFLLFDLA
ncbi:hypothetical protein [Glaesserella parasuis]|uniref:pirin family protein n=1 Tax=Glaesserella parasuis TaxID=738 RepID=UPI0024371540|nr:hypothetical protein [Glaesserella parasuis]MDG6338276.1 hypothetical protein [Glaesserella parasuis]MDG6351461.1 hypothetical protein [Glaesserella parasuis]